MATPRTKRPRWRVVNLTNVFAALCAVVMLWLVDHTFQRLIDINATRHTISVARGSIETSMEDLIIAESSQRGFILTGNPRYLDFFRHAASRIESRMTQLEDSTLRALSPAGGVVTFHQLLAQRLDELSASILSRASRPRDASTAPVPNADWILMSDFQRQGTELLKSADTLIAENDSQFRRLMSISRIAFMACVVTVLLAFILYVQQRHRLRLADLRQQQQLTAERDALESKVRERTAELADLATYLQHAVEAERTRLARELHDEMGALMMAAKLDVARLKSKLPAGAVGLRERLQHLNQALNDATALKRRIMNKLSPAALTTLGLVPTLEILAREFSQTAGVPVRTTLEAVDLDADRELTIYRAVQEALTNIGRYAKASRVEVTLRKRDDGAEVSVVDDGVGFDPARLSRASHGIVGMRHRLQACGGQLQVDAAVGRGTRITAIVRRA